MHQNPMPNSGAPTFKRSWLRVISIFWPQEGGRERERETEREREERRKKKKKKKKGDRERDYFPPVSRALHQQNASGQAVAEELASALEDSKAAF